MRLKQNCSLMSKQDHEMKQQTCTKITILRFAMYVTCMGICSHSYKLNIKSLHSLEIGEMQGRRQALGKWTG